LLSFITDRSTRLIAVDDVVSGINFGDALRVSRETCRANYREINRARSRAKSCRFNALA